MNELSDGQLALKDDSTTKTTIEMIELESYAQVGAQPTPASQPVPASQPTP